MMALLLIQGLEKVKETWYSPKGSGVQQSWTGLLLAAPEPFVWERNKFYTYSCGQDAGFVRLLDLSNFINIYYMPNTISHPSVNSKASRTLQVFPKIWWLLLVHVLGKNTLVKLKNLHEHPLFAKYVTGTVNIKTQSLPSKSLQLRGTERPKLSRKQYHRRYSRNNAESWEVGEPGAASRAWRGRPSPENLLKPYEGKCPLRYSLSSGSLFNFDSPPFYPSISKTGKGKGGQL